MGATKARQAIQKDRWDSRTLGTSGTPGTVGTPGHLPFYWQTDYYHLGGSRPNDRDLLLTNWPPADAGGSDNTNANYTLSFVRAAYRTAGIHRLYLRLYVRDVHWQLFECRHLSRAERDVVDGQLKMSEMRNRDQAVSQPADLRLADARRQMR